MNKPKHRCKEESSVAQAGKKQCFVKSEKSHEYSSYLDIQYFDFISFQL